MRYGTNRHDVAISLFLFSFFSLFLSFTMRARARAHREYKQYQVKHLLSSLLSPRSFGFTSPPRVSRSSLILDSLVSAREARIAATTMTMVVTGKRASGTRARARACAFPANTMTIHARHKYFLPLVYPQSETWTGAAT